ncbi:MAG: ABC transporter substrate-binding protein [Dehalococcoidia bacterium]|nr:ABC transporter substrate-binding protein [Dehalococcoidia bacterium]
MTSGNYWDRWWDRRANRRRVMLSGGTAAIGAAGLALVGCGDDDDEDGDATATATGTGTSTGSATATAAPTEKPVVGGTYRYIGGPIGGVLDIHRTNTPFESSGLWHWVGNFLIRFNAKTFEPEPDLAAAMPEIPGDGTLLTFKLRPEAKWQNKAPVNGRAVNAEDVKASFDRIKALGAKSPRSGNYANVDSITAIDATTVQFKLKAPQADLLNAMSDQYDLVIPKEIADRGEEAIQTIADVVGSGAYEATRYEAGQGMAVKKRADGYWKPDLAYWDGAEWTHQVDNQQKANALRTGQVDATDLPADLVRTFQDDSKFQILFEANPTRECLLINHNADRYKDVRVRQALWMLVDRELVYRNVFAGGGIAGGPMSPAAKNWLLPETELKTLPGFRDRATELKEAKALLEAAGLGNGFEEKLLTATAFNTNLLADVIIQNANELGIRLTPDNVGTDFNVMLRREIAGDYGLAATLFLSGPYPDAQLLIYHHSTAKGSRNYGKYANADMDAKLDKQATLYDVNERKPLVLDIQRELIKNPGPVWIGSRIQYYVLSSAIQNTVATPFLAGFPAAETYWKKG